MPNALFDFTDTQGPGSLSAIFSSVQQYLVENGFADDPEEEAEEAIATQRDLNDTVRDSAVVEGDEEATDDAPEALAFVPGHREAEDFGTPAYNVRAVEQFTNARQQEVTRLTIDLFVSFKFSQPAERPAQEQFQSRRNGGIGLTV